MRKLTNLFIVFHVVVLALWTFPPFKSEGQPKEKLGFGGLLSQHERLCTGWCSRALEPAFRYVAWLGLWQAWEIFSPEPWIANLRLKAEIERSDGSRAVWNAPEPVKLGYFDRYMNARFIYWRNLLRYPELTPAQIDAAKYFARTYATEGRTAKSVALVLEWSLIPKPLEQDFQPIPSYYPMDKSNVFHYQAFEGGSK